MIMIAGIGGALFPSRYLADAILTDSSHVSAHPHGSAAAFARWWRMLERSCGPASGLRAVFDLAAMPLFAMLGFRARQAVFDRAEARARLTSPGGAAIALVIRPWSERPSAVWKHPSEAAAETGAAWCFVFAPPFLSLLDMRGHATRRAVDFAFPDVFDGPSFAAFLAIASASAFDRPSGSPADAPSRIDALVRLAGEFQSRVRGDLQLGVACALDALADAIAGRPPKSATCRSAPPGSGAAAWQRAGDEALAIVYRVLFLLFAESRGLVPAAHPIYRRAYGVAELCRDALGGDVPGLWEALAAITRLSRSGCRTDDLVVSPFNGHLFARRAAPSLEATDRPVGPGRPPAGRDVAMARALVALGSRPGRAGREGIDYRDLGVEQLGAVYERVLDLTPGQPSTDSALRRRARAPVRHSDRRKETGTFYTPQPLAELVVRRTLAPLVAGRSADDILRLRVVDPAMGSGAFLVAACHYLAAAYDRALVDEGRLAPVDLDDDERARSRRLVAERCLAGVDRNPVAVQLARLSLWLTTLARGKPLGFLDHRLRAGDSLVGASPDDLLRRPGVSSRGPAELPLFEDERLEATMRRVIGPLAALATPDDTVQVVRIKEAEWRRLSSSDSPLAPWRLAAHAWCARWFWPAEAGGPPSIRELAAIQDAVLRDDRTLPAARLLDRLTAADRIARQRGFFHWPLEFADVFYDGDGQPKPAAGFDAVIGNPPWEMVRGDRHGKQSTGGRTADDALVRFVRESGIYRACGRGHLNLYQPFVERALTLTRRGGRVGLVLPWGFAVDDGAASLRVALFETDAIDTLVGLDNAGGLFPIHRGLRFLALVARRGADTRRIVARFGVKTAAELDDIPGDDVETTDVAAAPAAMSARRLAAVGGRARRIPDLRRLGDLELLEHLTAAFPPIGDASGWGATFGRELNATEDKPSFGAGELPVIEGKHLEPFQAHVDRTATRIDRARALARLADARFDRPRLGYRDVSGAANRVSLIAAVIPGGVVTTHTIFCLRTSISPLAMYFLSGLFNSYVLNSVVRMLMGSHVTTSLVEALPAPPWRGSALERAIAVRARQLASKRAPAIAAAHLHADVARLYRLSPVQFRHVLDGFPLVARVDRDAAARAFESR